MKHRISISLLLSGALLLPALSCRAAVHAPVVSTIALPPNPATNAYAHQYIASALKSCDFVEKNLPQTQRVAEIIATRHLAGGMLGSIGNGQGLLEEITGRSGGMMNFGFDRGWEKTRTPAEDANNILFVAWDRAPTADELAQVKKMKDAGTYVIGFGQRTLPALADQVALCDAWLDTGLGAEDGVVKLPDGKRAGRANLLVNMLNGWSLIAETVAALTRHGKMPAMYKSYMTAEGMAWGNKYAGKTQFHDDLTVPPIPAGQLTRAFLKEIRDNIKRFELTQSLGVAKAAELITDEMRAGRKTVVATMGHAPYTFIGKYEDAAWANGIDFDSGVPAHVAAYQNTPEGALVLRLGYTGMAKEDTDIFTAKKQRVILITAENPRPEMQVPEDKLLLHIDMGYAFGDAAVSVEGYPIKLFPPSGIMQIVAYESINVEVLARLQKHAQAA